jgi:hypothetical protein
MPFIVACPVISFLRRCAYTMKRGERATEQRDEIAAFHSITSSERANIDSYLLSAEMNVFPDGPTPVIWMITSPSLAHV